MVFLNIGENAEYNDTDDGTTNGDGSLILLGEFDLDYVNGSSGEYDTQNGPIAFARAKPGLDLIQGGAQVYKIIQFTGSGEGRVKFNMGVLADEVPIEFDGASIRRDDSFSSPVAFRVDESLFDEVADGTGEVALAMVDLRREVGDRVAAVDRGEDLEFDAPEYGVT